MSSPAIQAIDPRVIRSRQMLMDALRRLLSKKDFEHISVQEIASESNLNRATFYLHYTDKNALLRAMTEARFRDLLVRRGITVIDCNGALRAIAMGVCDYLSESTSCPRQRPHEVAIVGVIEDMMKEGFKHHPPPPGCDVELAAATAAWAVFGAAYHWSQRPGRVPAEDIAGMIEALVTPVLHSGQP